jgi:acyl-CoA synthetase (AMP-forming)/AMP-acid ligase II
MYNKRLVGLESSLMRGTGLDLGPLAPRMPAAERTLHHVLDRQVAERPDHDWLVFDGRDRLTFAAAREQARRFADRRRRTEVAGNTAPLLRNQIEFMPAFLGAQLAGGIAVPLNPELRGPMLERLLGRSRAGPVVVAAELLGELEALESLGEVGLVLACAGGAPPPESIHGVPVIGFDESLAEGAVDPPKRLPEPWEVGLLVFTSGTSGGSKAPVWTHHYLHFSSACVSDALGHGPGDVLSTPLQMCHIAGLQNFANSALQVGCTAQLQSRFSVRRGGRTSPATAPPSRC